MENKIGHVSKLNMNDRTSSNAERSMYGKELIIDLHNVDVSKCNRFDLKKYLVELCNLIEMDREDLYWWDYDTKEEYDEASAHLKGITVVQFITTSNIVIHTVDDLKRIYINIFSCKEFNAQDAIDFTEKYFSGKAVNTHVIVRD